MADAVTTQVLLDNARNFVTKFTNVSDATGETNVVKVDASADLPNPVAHLKIKKIKYDCKTMAVRLKWDASSPVDIAILSGFGTLDFTDFGGLTNNAGAGVTGKITFTTIGAAASSTYTIIIECIKAVGTAAG